MNKLSGRDIVIVGLHSWDVETESNCKNIALEFSKNNRVLYVNSPLDRITVIKEKKDPNVQMRLDIMKGKAPDLVQVNAKLWNFYPSTVLESVNWLKNDEMFDTFNKRNNKKFAKEIEHAMSMLGFKDIILFNDNDIFRSFYLPDILKPDLSIYYSSDNFAAIDHWKRHSEKLEPELIRKNDICLTNSAYLADYCKKHNPNTFYVGQGFDPDKYIDLDKDNFPSEMNYIESPVIGYIGELSSLKLDIDALTYIAERKLDWNLVLIGPEDDTFMNSSLHEMKNVYFLGTKDPQDLPAFINAFDICINPQIINDATKANYPGKIDEYLAAGKAVVAAKTEAMNIFKDHVYLAEKKEDFIELIEKALKEENKEGERKNFAKQHTWENSVEQIYRAINLSRSYARTA